MGGCAKSSPAHAPGANRRQSSRQPYAQCAAGSPPPPPLPPTSGFRRCSPCRPLRPGLATHLPRWRSAPSAPGPRAPPLRWAPARRRGRSAPPGAPPRPVPQLPERRLAVGRSAGGWWEHMGELGQQGQGGQAGCQRKAGRRGKPLPGADAAGGGGRVAVALPRMRGVPPCLCCITTTPTPNLAEHHRPVRQHLLSHPPTNSPTPTARGRPARMAKDKDQNGHLTSRSTTPRRAAPRVPAREGPGLKRRSPPSLCLQLRAKGRAAHPRAAAAAAAARWRRLARPRPAGRPRADVQSSWRSLGPRGRPAAPPAAPARLHAVRPSGRPAGQRMGGGREEVWRDGLA